MVANPAVLALSNGTLLMAYRGLNDEGIGMATSPAWDVNFTRLNGGAAVLGPESAAQTAVCEDMTMWADPARKAIHMILHQEGRGAAVGAHAYSLDDGLSWSIAGDAYNLTVLHEDGSSSTYTRRERPQTLKDAKGQPLALFSGVEDTSGGYTHTIAAPLKV